MRCRSVSWSSPSAVVVSVHPCQITLEPLPAGIKTPSAAPLVGKVLQVSLKIKGASTLLLSRFAETDLLFHNVGSVLALSEV